MTPRSLLWIAALAVGTSLQGQQITLVAAGDVNWSRWLRRPDVFFDRDTIQKGEWPKVPYLNVSELGPIREVVPRADTSWRRDRKNIEYDLKFASQQADDRYPLEKIAPLFRAADVGFLNLEGPLTDAGRWTGQFHGSPTFADALRWAGVTVVSLANNHALDDGEEGLLQTIANVARAGVGSVGAGRDLAAARRPYIVERKGIRIGFLGYAQEVNGGPDAFAMPGKSGVAALDPRLIQADIRALRDQVDLVVVSLHWGTENHQETEPAQREFAHRVLDAGADAILGHHPHVPRGVEVYDGKPIFYSFGNLIFGHTHDYWMDNYAARLTIEKKKGATRVTRIEILPTAGTLAALAQPWVLTGEAARPRLLDIQKRSEELETRMEIRGDVGIIEPSAARLPGKLAGER